MNDYTPQFSINLSTDFIGLKEIPAVSGIYCIHCLVDGKLYIGSAVNLRQRARNHQSELTQKKHFNRYLENAWHKHGSDQFCFEIVEFCDRSELISREQYWLDAIQTFNRKIGYNIALSTSAPMLGRKPTPETIAKITAKTRGRAVSIETRAKIGAAHKGKQISEEHRKKVGDANRGNKYTLGKKASAQTKEKMSRMRKGNPSPNRGRVFSQEWRDNIGKSKKGNTYKRGLISSPETKKKISQSKSFDYIVTSPNGEEFTIHGLREFCEMNNLNKSHMTQIALGNKSSHKGWKCRYAT